MSDFDWIFIKKQLIIAAYTPPCGDSTQHFAAFTPQAWREGGNYVRSSNVSQALRRKITFHVCARALLRCTQHP